MLEKRGYFVAVKAPNWSKFILKYHEAYSLEQAQAFVKRYCDYWRKKRCYVSEEAYRVIYHPVTLYISYTFNVGVSPRRLHCIHAYLDALKSGVIYTDHASETADIDIQKQCYTMYADREICEEKIKNVISDYFKGLQRENIIIDYSVQQFSHYQDEIYTDFPVVKSFKDYQYLINF